MLRDFVTNAFCQLVFMPPYPANYIDQNKQTHTQKHIRSHARIHKHTHTHPK